MLQDSSRFHKRRSTLCERKEAELGLLVPLHFKMRGREERVKTLGVDLMIARVVGLR